MTLVITEISNLGIAMVADSAVTFTEALPSGNKIRYVLNGAQKLQVIPYLNAGISVWGLGEIRKLSTVIWLKEFIERNASAESLDEFASRLAEELQWAIGSIKQPIGFHLAGYVDIEDRRLPTFYHVRNVDGAYRDYQYHNFILGQDYPPQAISENQTHLTRNGDFGPYAVLTESVENALPHIQLGMGFTIPYPSLEGRITYHSAWVRFISEIYASSERLKTIGGNVSALGIYPDNRIIYLPNS